MSPEAGRPERSIAIPQTSQLKSKPQPLGPDLTALKSIKTINNQQDNQLFGHRI